MSGATEQTQSETRAKAHNRWTVIGLCMLFNLINGQNALAMAFVASTVSAQWLLSGLQQGALLSASLIGMAGGSMFAAPLADRHGRRPLLVASLLLSASTMALSFWCDGPWSLGLLRGLTGLGVGAVLVGANVLTHEYASERRRSLAIALQSLAFALGAILGGLLAHVFSENAGWRYVFLAGGALTLAAGLAGAVWLRESSQFLSLKASPAHARHPRRGGNRARLSSRQWRETLSLAAAFFLVMFCFYFVVSWTPTLLIQAGASEQHGIEGGMLLNLGGMLGALLMGLAANRYGTRPLLVGCLVLNAGLMSLMVPATHLLGVAIGLGFSIGLLLNGAIAGLYTLAPQSYGTGERASGVGLVVGVGRLGSILSPSIAGLLLDAQWSLQALFTFYAGSLLLAALVVGRHPPR